MVLSSSSGDVTFLLKKMILWDPITNLRGSEHMICEFQKQYELDYTDKTPDVRKQVTDRKKL